MDIPKYAKLENERRFLVNREIVPDLTTVGFRLIEDLYLSNSRLRLRSVTDSVTGKRELKLCKKYGSNDPMSEPIVNIYLAPSEYELLAKLPGSPIRKRRYRVEHRNQTFGIDVFLDNLAGLVLCEKEAATVDIARALEAPPWAKCEVTADLFFTGGNLCQLSADELQGRLAQP
jgi:CYTH domain-containing protein